METEDDAEGVVWPVKFKVEYSKDSPMNEKVLRSGSLSPGSKTEMTVIANTGSKMMFTSLPIVSLTPELYSVMVSQQKFFEASQHDQLLENSIKSTLASIGKKKGVASAGRKFTEGAHFDYYEVMYELGTEAEINQGSIVRGRARHGGRAGGQSMSSVNRRKAHSISADAKDDTEGDPSRSTTKRSRSSGATSSNRKGQSVERNAVPPSEEAKTETADDASDEADDEGSDEIREQEIKYLETKFSVFRSMPTDVQAIAARYRGPICGVWVAAQPVQICPVKFLQSLTHIQENNSFSDAKRMEWYLDLIREYDEKRIECFEEFLINNRANVDIQLNHNIIKAGVDGSTGKGKKDDTRTMLKEKEYYKDKGRLPRRSRSYYIR